MALNPEAVCNHLNICISSVFSNKQVTYGETIPK